MADSAAALPARRFAFLPRLESRGYHLLLKFRSGLAVANILRALTDPVLLRRSVAQLGGGFGLGAALTLAAEKGGAAFLTAINFSASTFGAGIIVGARIGVPAIVVGL